MEEFSELQTPPKPYENHCVPILKHFGPNGCKMLHAPFEAP